MKIRTNFLKSIVSGVLNKVIKLKLGCKAAIRLNEFDAKIGDGQVHAHLSIDAEMTPAELNKLLKAVGF